MSLVNYSRQFIEASHILLKNGLWRVLASLASPRKTARRMLRVWQVRATRLGECRQVWRVRATRLANVGASPHDKIGRFNTNNIFYVFKTV